MGNPESLTAAERETIIGSSDAEELWHIETYQQSVIHKLMKDPSFTLVEQGFVGGTQYAKFTIPKTEWNPLRGRKRRLSEETKKANTLRLHLHT